MTTEQMIADFQEQLKKIVEEIRDLDSQINAKKEQYFRLQGAVEALNMTQKTTEASKEVESEPVTE
jgi:uncharacterized protein (DUF3084 family)